MSWKALNAAWELNGLHHTEKLVLVYMADKANPSEGDLFWMKQATIARACGLTERTVMRVQAALMDAGHISLAANKGRAMEGMARFSFFVHPKSNSTSDNGDTDTGKPVHRQVTITPPTSDNGDTTIITTIKTIEASMKRLNDASRDVNKSARKVGGLIAHRSVSAFERQAMARLRGLVGDDEMARVGGHWRNWIRRHPRIIESAMNDLESRMKEITAGVAEPIVNRGAWLMDLCKRLKDARANAA